MHGCSLKPSAALLTAALTAACGSALAEPVLTVDTIVVSGSRSAEDLLSLPSSISVVQPDRTITADNVPDMLKDVGSVNLVSDGTPGVKRTALRS